MQIENKSKQIELKLNGHSNGITKDLKKKILNRKFLSNPLVESLEYKLNDKIESFKINKVIENAIHWCLVNGFVLVPKTRKPEDLMIVSYLPFTVFPTPFIRSHFEQVFNLQPSINNLIYRISNSSNFMENAFESLNGQDKFLNSLWSIYKKAQTEGYNQKIRLNLTRCDYMLHQMNTNENSICMKQVEMNTIAAGFGYVSTKASKLHRELLKWTNNTDILDRVPFNEPVIKMAQGFVEAWRLYNVKNSIVLFIVLDVEINIADQRHLEYEVINQEPNIEIQRCTLIELYQFGYLDNNKTLYYHNREVSLVYYRAGYDPSHFKSEKEWETLYKIEISKAVKCPTVGTFLAGMKKIQEYISNEENLNQICDHNTQLVKSFKSVFANFFLLDSQENIDKVMKNPENYVLKPQREGGGHNFYNQDIITILDKINKLKNDSAKKNLNESEEIYNKDLYIVMEFLRPVISDNYIISPKSQQKLYETGQEGTLNKIPITNELGIFGALVMNGNEIVLNQTCGYCLRSKPAEDNEAGVMCGSGALDSIYFLD